MVSFRYSYSHSPSVQGHQQGEAITSGDVNQRRISDLKDGVPGWWKQGTDVCSTGYTDRDRKFTGTFGHILKSFRERAERLKARIAEKKAGRRDGKIEL